MYKKYLNARSPLRLLEKGLHGGLGVGNLGVVLAGHGVGKTAFLVGVALDELLRAGRVLHVCLDHTVAHVRAHYDTVFEELAASTHLENGRELHAEIDRHRSIRVYPPNTLTASKLRDAVKFEIDAGAKPSLLILEGLDFQTLAAGELAEIKALAAELAAEVWISSPVAEERVASLPAPLRKLGDLISVVLSLEPGDGVVGLRALKDHESPDPTALRVSLDPRTLLLVRS
ncbi:MAG TPA: hypothetical protein VII72_11450 [Myxococcota bacterium]